MTFCGLAEGAQRESIGYTNINICRAACKNKRDGGSYLYLGHSKAPPPSAAALSARALYQARHSNEKKTLQFFLARKNV